MSREIQDSALLEFASSVKDHTVIITGGASGIGKETAFLFAKYGARVVVGDINSKAAEDTVSDIVQSGGQAIWRKCNVQEYDAQLQLFEAALATYGSVDIVIPCAGLTEQCPVLAIQLDDKGLPKQPNLVTFDVNFTSVVYSVQLAYHFFQKPSRAKKKKSLTIVGSMLGLNALQAAVAYSSSKHALVPLVRSLKPDFEEKGFRIAIVCPWFADTPLVPKIIRQILTGMPLVTVNRVASMMLLAATDEAQGTNGGAYTTPDSGLVFRMKSEDLEDEAEFKRVLSDRLKDEHRQTLPESILTATMFLRLFKAPLISLVRVVTLCVAGRITYGILQRTAY